MVHPFEVPGLPPIPRHSGDKRPRDPSDIPSDGCNEATAKGKGGSVDDLIEAFNEMMRTARPGTRPAAWLRAAQSAEGADYLSLFDGENNSINRAAAIFNLVGLPAVDLNALYPVNL